MKIYRSALLLTQNADRSLLSDAALAVESGRVADLGPAAEVLARHPGVPVSDEGDTVLLPGLVNGHAHIPMCVFRGYADDLALMEWLTKHIFPAEAKWTRDAVKAAAAYSCLELLRFGCTTVYDMYMDEESIGEAVFESGIRAVLGESLSSMTYGAPGAMERFADVARARKAAWAGRGRVTPGIAPHAVYSTSPELLTAAYALAEELDVPFGMHMSETVGETAGMIEKTGKRPVAYCRDLGVLGKRTTLFHMVDTDEADMETVASAGCAVVHNPASNMKLSSGFSPLTAMLRHGIPVGIGTDGPASNNAQNMVREMYLTALLQKGFRADPLEMPAGTVLDMATRNGAAVVKNPDVGSLEIGKNADFIGVDLRALNLQPVHKIVSNLVYAATGAEVRLTVVGGDELYRDGAFPAVDEAKIRADMRQALTTLGLTA